MRKQKPYGSAQNRNRHPSYLSYIEVSITEHCNLNCAGCSNFSPLAKEHFADLERFEKSIKKISELADRKVDEVRLIGGEPLLNKNILEYFYIIDKYLPNAFLSIFTNGITFPSQSETFFKYIKDNNVFIYMSNYFGESFKTKINDISIKYDIEKNIYFVSTNNKEKEFNNISIDIEGNLDGEKNYEECFLGRRCLHMRDDKIFICPVVAHIDHFNKFFKKDLSLTKQDYINIDELDSLKELIEFLNEKKDNSFCKYCDLNARNSESFPMRHTEYNIYEWYKKKKD